LLLQEGNRVAATINVVPSIEAQPQLTRWEQREEAIDFFRSLHVAASMMVKCYPQADCLAERDYFTDH
jgi:hypothetical protein